MSTTTDRHPLLSATRPPAGFVPGEALLEELRDLAMQHDHCSARSRVLHEQLRKMLGQDRLTTCLLGIQSLAMAAEPAGARLLAALLDANTPGAMLLPRVRRFQSTGRLLRTDADLVGASFLAQWQRRLADIVPICAERFGQAGDEDQARHPYAAEHPPLPLLRRALTGLTPGAAARPRRQPAAEDLRLLAGLVRLECDAYQERVSRLAGAIDPFRVAAVMRVLPLLNRADAEVRDLDLLAAWLENGEFAAAFERRLPTGWEVIEEPERPRLIAAFATDERLAPLAAVHGAFLAAPMSIRQLAGPVARLLVLSQALMRAGLRPEPLHLLDAVHLVLAHSPHDHLEIPVGGELQEAISCSLLSSRQGSRDDLAGLQLQAGRLVLPQPRLALGDRIWRHDLPTTAEVQDEPTAPCAGAAAAADGAAGDRQRTDVVPPDASAQAVKQLVMNNIGCVSILLGFLRNPKVTAICGLVAEVARRTRSSRILEVIASDRGLTTGQANKDVPRALLESPVNISIKTLRPFIHVKYVSKTDLRRLAKDKARLRKEVCQEIEAYLESLT